MKKVISLLLAGVMMVSAVPVTFAAGTQDHSLGTQVTYTAANNESYFITVPAKLNPGQSGTVTLDGYWPDSKTVTVTAEKTVTLKNSIKAADTKTLNVTFLGISEAGSNTSKQTFTETVSVEGISNALFGTWSGKFNYNVNTTEEDVPPSENYVGTVSADNTITLSGVESAGTYTLRYANANGALENYADICSLEVTDPAAAVSYDDLIAENCAPVEATSIAVYNAANEKVGDIALGGLKTNLGTKLYSFGAVADSHINASNYPERDTNFIRALTYFNEVENVAFIVDGGDLTDEGTAEELTKLRNMANTYSSVPVYFGAGNHDSKSGVNMLTEFETYAGNAPYFSFTHGNDVFIVLGLNYWQEEANQMFTREQWQWLYETLEANRDKRCFVFEHLFLDFGAGDPDNLLSYGNLLRDTEEAVLTSLLSHYSNVIYMHGHSHFEFAMQKDNDMANYDSRLGIHSVHMSSIGETRVVDADGSLKYLPTTSEGYVVDVYENGIVLRGRDFAGQNFLPIAQYNLDTRIKHVGPNSYTDSNGWIDTTGIRNKLSTAIDESGNLYNGKGWKEDTRYSTSSQAEKSFTGYDLSGYIRVRMGDVVRFENMEFHDLSGDGGTSPQSGFLWYDENFAFMGNETANADKILSASWKPIYNENGDLIQITIPYWYEGTYLRFCVGDFNENSVITINQK